MKRKLWLILLCFVLFSCGSTAGVKNNDKNFDATVAIKDYVSKDFKNYDFICKNPLNYTYYYPDLNEIKGKIVRICSEDYDYRDGWGAIYSDTDVRSAEHEYHYFDKNGLLYKIRVVKLSDNLMYSSFYDETSTYTKNTGYHDLVYYSNSKSNEEDTKGTLFYNAYISKDGYLIYERRSKYTNEVLKTIKFKEGIIIEESWSDGIKTREQQLTYNVNKWCLTYYDVIDGKLVVNEIREYEDGHLVRWGQYNSDYTDEKIYNYKTNICSQTFVQNGRTYKKKHSILQKDSPSGLQLLQDLGPEKSIFGDHYIKKTSFLDKEDAVIKNYYNKDKNLYKIKDFNVVPVNPINDHDVYFYEYINDEKNNSNSKYIEFTGLIYAHGDKPILNLLESKKTAAGQVIYLDRKIIHHDTFKFVYWLKPYPLNKSVSGRATIEFEYKNNEYVVKSFENNVTQKYKKNEITGKEVPDEYGNIEKEYKFTKEDLLLLLYDKELGF